MDREISNRLAELGSRVSDLKFRIGEEETDIYSADGRQVGRIDHRNRCAYVSFKADEDFVDGISACFNGYRIDFEDFDGKKEEPTPSERKDKYRDALESLDITRT